jgi:hypothetical protein
MTRLRAERSRNGIRFQAGAHTTVFLLVTVFFQLWDPPRSVLWVTGGPPPGLRLSSLKLHVVPRLRMSGVLPLRHVKDVCIIKHGTTLPWRLL